MPIYFYFFLLVDVGACRLGTTQKMTRTLDEVVAALQIAFPSPKHAISFAASTRTGCVVRTDRVVPFGDDVPRTYSATFHTDAALHDVEKMIGNVRKHLDDFFDRATISNDEVALHSTLGSDMRVATVAGDRATIELIPKLPPSLGPGRTISDVADAIAFGLPPIEFKVTHERNCVRVTRIKQWPGKTYGHLSWAFEMADDISFESMPQMPVIEWVVRAIENVHKFT